MMHKSTRNRVAEPAKGVSGMAVGLVVSLLATGLVVNTAVSNESNGLDTAPTSVARAVSEGVASSEAGQPATAPLPHSVEIPNRRILLSRSREMMQADNRQVEEVAERLKVIIKARYEAEALSAGSLATINDLQEKIAEYEALLRQAGDQQKLLKSDKEALEDRLNLVMGERDGALGDLGLLNSQVQDQAGEVVSLQEKARENDRELAKRQQQIADLNAQINDLTGQRDNALARSEQVQADLQENQHELDKLTEKLAGMTADLEAVGTRKDQAENALATSQAILNERENKLARLNGMMTSKADELGALERQLNDKNKAIDDLQGQVSRLTGERDDVRDQLAVATQQIAAVQDEVSEKSGQLNNLQRELNEIASQRDSTNGKLASVEARLAGKQKEIDALGDQLDKLKSQRVAALAEVDDLRQKLARSEGTANNFLTERDSLADMLNLIENKAADAGNSFADEQKAHTQTRANLFALQREADGLRQSIDQLNDEKNALLNDAMELKSSRAALDGQLQATRDELLARQNELQAALSSITNLNGRIAALAKERDILTAKVDELSGEVVALKAGEGDYQNLLAGNSTKHAAELKALEAELAAKNQNIALLQKGIDDLAADLADEQERTARTIADKDSAIANLNARISDLVDNRQMLHLARQQGEHEIDNLSADIDSLTASRNASLETIDQLKGLNAQLTSDLADAEKKFDQFKADSEMELSTLEQQIIDLSESGDMQEEEIAKLQALNDELAGKLRSNREKLELVSAESAEKIQTLSAELDKMLLREERYKANALETGEKLNELASLNQQLNAELGAHRNELQVAREKLNDLVAAQQMAEAERDRIAAEAEQLRVSLTDELDKARLENITVQKARADNSIPLRLGNADFFETGSAKLTRAGGEKLTQLAKIIHTFHDRRIVVEGHTDDVPIGPTLLSRYATNWELSVARAAAAVRHMQRETDIDPRNLSAAGYGEFQPVGDNSTEEGKQMNRRVEVVLYPREVEFKNIDDVNNDEPDIRTMTSIDE